MVHGPCGSISAGTDCRVKQTVLEVSPGDQAAPPWTCDTSKCLSKTLNCSHVFSKTLNCFQKNGENMVVDSEVSSLESLSPDTFLHMDPCAELNFALAATPKLNTEKLERNSTCLSRTWRIRPVVSVEGLLCCEVKFSRWQTSQIGYLVSLLLLLSR